MKFGDKLTFNITHVDKKGRGVGAAPSGKPAAVPFAAPGETVEAKMVSRDKGFFKMELESVITPSVHRVTPPCKYAGKCGGCAWQQFDYAYQLELKRGLVNAALENAGIGRVIEAVVPAVETFNYRNRMDYCVGWKGEIGLKEPGRWNAYLDLSECHLLSPEAVEVMSRFRALMKEHNLEPWDAKFQKGFVRYLVIREGKNTKQRMVSIITSEGVFSDTARSAIIEALSPLATTLYHGINPTVTDLSIADRLELLHGAPLLEEIVDGKTFTIHPNSFFQTNTRMAEALVHKVREFLTADGGAAPQVLLDLYCGVGLFGICLARDARRVVGVEIDPYAIDMARENAKRNGLTNTEYFAAKTESLVWEKEEPDTVIIDPPRAGLHPAVVETLLNRKPPRLVYVSCNYESFAREWKELSAVYEIKRIEAMDLFPHSPHVELVTLLVKKSA